MRYEHETPGDLLHLDIKTPGRIEAVGRRTGDRVIMRRGAGWESLFVAVDDHSRFCFTQMQPSEGRACEVAFLTAAIHYYALLGVTIRRILTDNGPAFRSKAFAQACRELGLRHRFTKPYCPQTNGKAERFIGSALREWAYGFICQHSNQRTAVLHHWTHHYTGIGRIKASAVCRLEPGCRGITCCSSRVGS